MTINSMKNIPKLIHYCWFGGKSIPANLQKYIDGWHETLTDYQIIRWDESNVDLKECEYLKQAVKSCKWAFVADYVRLKKLYEFGGIYLDTDVEVLKTFEELLDKKFVLGFETTRQVNGAIILSEKNFWFLKVMTQQYESIDFEGRNIINDLIPIPYTLTHTLERYGLKGNDSIQELQQGITILSREYLYPLSYIGEKKILTKNTYTIHHYYGSWSSRVTKLSVLLKIKVGLDISPVIKGISKIKNKLRGKK